MSEKVVKEKKPKSKLRKTLEWVFTGLFAALLVFFAGVNIYGQVSARDNFNVPSYFGYSILVVQTDSMEPEYKVNSTVIVQKVDFSEIKIDDDLTFFWTGDGLNYPMTHRVSEIKTPEESGDGHYYFTTHGINKESSQCAGDCTGQTQYFADNYVIGKVVGNSVFLGGVFNFLTQWYGLLILLLIPCGYLIITSIMDISRAIKTDDEGEVVVEQSAENNDSVLTNISEEDRKRLKEELLNQMLEEKGLKKDE